MMKWSAFLTLGQFILMLALLIAFFAFPNVPTLLGAIVGLILVLVGVMMMGLSLYEHGSVRETMPGLSPIPEDDIELIDSGIYAHIRHPIYGGMLLGAFGVTLVHGHLGVLLVTLAMTFFLTYKANCEERLLQQIYPQRYPIYQQHTGRFLPPIRLR